jgi:hypothetical protein
MVRFAVCESPGNSASASETLKPLSISMKHGRVNGLPTRRQPTEPAGGVVAASEPSAEGQTAAWVRVFTNQPFPCSSGPR